MISIKINRNFVFYTLFFTSFFLKSQIISVYKINDLLRRIYNDSDTTYVVNFWATWCKPCVTELPEFEKLNNDTAIKNTKVLLVSMDFKEELNKKLKTFLEKHPYSSEIVLLDEINGNDFIDKISVQWSGAIPATLVTSKNKSINRFFEQKITYDFLVNNLK